MNLFGNKNSSKTKKFLIFLVEDNAIYLRQLEHLIQSKFGEKAEVECMPVAEVAEIKIQNGDIPDLLIMDHYLNDRYEDAEEGFDVLKRLKKEYPSIEFILHSSQQSIELALSIAKEGICTYIAKGDDGFNKIEAEIKKLIK
ncbi:MAG: response regulator [Bacteroidota bacterium]